MRRLPIDVAAPSNGSTQDEKERGGRRKKEWDQKEEGGKEKRTRRGKREGEEIFERSSRKETETETLGMTETENHRGQFHHQR